MKALSLFLLLFTPCSAAVCLADEVREIPLSEVWAIDMPGTRDLLSDQNGLLTESSPDSRKEYKESLALLRTLQEVSHADPDHTPGPALLLTGSHCAALSKSPRRIANKANHDEVHTRQRCTVLFYAYSLSGRLLTIDCVRVSGQRIHIVCRSPTNSTAHYRGPRFALIPVGSFGPGEVSIEIECLDYEIGSGDVSPVTPWWSRFVCKSSTATVSTSTRRALQLHDIYAYQMPWTRDVEDINSALHNEESTSVADALAKYFFMQANKKRARRHADRVLLVQGSAEEALRQAYLLLVEPDTPVSYSSSDQLWIFFYAPLGNSHVSITSVEDTGANIELGYRQVHHESTEVGCHFALIPIGSRNQGVLNVLVREAHPLSDRLRDTNESYDTRPVHRSSETSSFAIGE